MRRGRQMLAGWGRLQHSEKSQTRPGAGWGSNLATSPREKRRLRLVCYYASKLVCYYASKLNCSG